MTTEKMYKTSEVAELFGVKPATVRVWVEERRIDHVRTPTGRIRISQSEIDRWLKERR